MTTPRHTAHLAVTVQFEGDYYGPDELVAVCDDWIGHGFCDRDDLTGYTLTGTVTRTGEAAPRFTCGSPCPQHEHACARSVGHGAPCRDAKQKGTEGCTWAGSAGPGTASKEGGPR